MIQYVQPVEGGIGDMTDDKTSLQDAECCLEEVGAVVQRLVRIFQLFERDQIKIYGITSSQCYTLLEIGRTGSLTMNELSTKMNLDTSTMTRVIANLVRDGLVRRVRDDSDRRYVVVELTDKGKSFTGEIKTSIENYYCDIITALPPGQVEQVLSSAQSLLAAFERANPNCC
jgi:DNA-binding MarR family transcriptional regulator